jgi:hypothetical protein
MHEAEEKLLDRGRAAPLTRREIVGSHRQVREVRGNDQEELIIGRVEGVPEVPGLLELAPVRPDDVPEAEDLGQRGGFRVRSVV